MDEYAPRVIDAELDVLLGALPAVAIEGARAVGKTATAQRRARTVHRLDDPRGLEVIEADPWRVVSGEPPVLIDEWQRVPSTWDAVRRAVDDDRSPGRFLLTGSAPPASAPTHSGAGRIVAVRMRPMALSERGLAEPTVSLENLLTGQRDTLSGSTSLRLADYAEQIVRSGLPGLQGLPERPLRTELDSYLHRVIDHDFEQLGQRVRNPPALRRWLTAYAAATATTAPFETIRDASSSGEGETPARSTTIPYRDALEALWILDPLPAWLPTRNHLSRLSSGPKHHVADPALAARLLRVDIGGLLDGESPGPVVPRDGTLLGHLLESLITLGVRTYAQAAEASVGHLRTWNGRHEIDLIVERQDRRVLAMEVKLAGTVTDADVRHLQWLRGEIGDDLLDAVVITTGQEAYRRPDGIAVVPAALLGP